MTERPADRGTARLAPAIVGAIAFVVYARTVLPGMAFGDWGEMQTVPHVLGVAHPTGYPTYVLLAWFAQLVPVGSIALRANLLSGGLVALALAGSVSILIGIGVRPAIAAGTALALGAVGTVWAAATVAEVNPLHLLFIVLLLQRALAWAAHRRLRDLVLGGLLLGLSLGNHLLTLFAAPCIAAFVLWVGRREIAVRPWIVVPAAAAGLLGLSVYLYIPIAAGLAPPLPYNHPVTLDAVWWLVSGTQFRGQFDFLSPNGPGDFVGSLPALWSVLAERATPFFPLLGLAGLALLVRRRAAVGWLCVALLLTHAYVWSTYLWLEHYLLVPWLVLAIGAAVGLDTIAREVGAAVAVPWGSRAAGLVGAASLVLAIGLAAMNWAAADRSAERGAEIYVDAMFDALPQGAAIVSQWDTSTPLWHGRFVLGHRPDVLVVDDTNIVYEGWGIRERRIGSLICERPVFIIRLDDGDLDATRAEYRLEPFLAVRVAYGGPAAAVVRQVYRVEPLDPTACGA